MSILENELIKKYFGFDALDPVAKKLARQENWHPQAVLANNVLKAMEEPIKNGDKYLSIYDSGNVDEGEAVHGWPVDLRIHPNTLRLPDQFQESRSPQIS